MVETLASWSNNISQQRLTYCKPSPSRLTIPSMSTLLRVNTAFPPSVCEPGLTCEPLTLCCCPSRCLITLPSSPPSNQRINKVFKTFLEKDKRNLRNPTWLDDNNPVCVGRVPLLSGDSLQHLDQPGFEHQIQSLYLKV